MWHFLPHIVVPVIVSSTTVSPQAFTLAVTSFFLPVTSLDMGMRLTQPSLSCEGKTAARIPDTNVFAPKGRQKKIRWHPFFEMSLYGQDTRTTVAIIPWQRIKERTTELRNEITWFPVDIMELLYQPTWEFTLPLNFLLCEITRFLII